MSFIKTQRLVVLLAVIAAVNGFLFNLFPRKITLLSPKTPLVKPMNAAPSSTVAKPKAKKKNPWWPLFPIISTMESEPEQTFHDEVQIKDESNSISRPIFRATRKKLKAVKAFATVSSILAEGNGNKDDYSDLTPSMPIQAISEASFMKIVDVEPVIVASTPLTVVDELKPLVHDNVVPPVENAAKEIIAAASTFAPDVVDQVVGEVVEISLPAMSEQVVIPDAPAMMEAVDVHVDVGQVVADADVVSVMEIATAEKIEAVSNPILVAAELNDEVVEISVAKTPVFEAKLDMAAKIQEINSYAEAEMPMEPSLGPSKYRYAPFMKAVASYFTRGQPATSNAAPGMEMAASESIATASLPVSLDAAQANKAPSIVAKPSSETSRYRYAPFMKAVTSYFTRAQPVAKPALAVEVSKPFAEQVTPGIVRMKKYASWQKEWRQF
jgi:hypothetical protein